jgi:hypothetical protein
MKETKCYRLWGRPTKLAVQVEYILFINFIQQSVTTGTACKIAF